MGEPACNVDPGTTIGRLLHLAEHINSPSYVAWLREVAGELEDAASALVASEATVQALTNAGNELAHWLQLAIDDDPGAEWGYSEGAICDWRAALAAAGQPGPTREGQE